MKISTKFGGVIISIISAAIILMIITLTSIKGIEQYIYQQQNITTATMIRTLFLQNDVVQIQQWLTDVSATRGESGFNDGFTMAKHHYESAHSHINTLRGQQLAIQ